LVLFSIEHNDGRYGDEIPDEHVDQGPDHGAVIAGLHMAGVAKVQPATRPLRSGAGADTGALSTMVAGEINDLVNGAPHPL